MRFRTALSKLLTEFDGGGSAEKISLGRHHIHSKIDSILRENQVNSTATLSFVQGMALGSQRPDINSWSSAEKHLLDTVHGMMKDEMTRPSLIQPMVKASYAVAGILVGRVASPDMRDAILGGLYDSVQDSATDQLRALYENNETLDKTEDMRSLIKTLRDTREDLVPEVHTGIHDIALGLFSILQGKSDDQEMDIDRIGTAPEVAATLTKHMTSLLTHIAKTV